MSLDLVSSPENRSNAGFCKVTLSVLLICTYHVRVHSHACEKAKGRRRPALFHSVAVVASGLIPRLLRLLSLPVVVMIHRQLSFCPEMLSTEPAWYNPFGLR